MEGQTDLFAHAGAAAESGRFGREALARLLNGPQLDAVVAPPGPLLVVAGAGSGKTRVITHRLARLLATGAEASRIFVVTFTNKAAGELKERASHLLAEYPGVLGGLWLGTFHSLSARLLRRYGEAVGLRRDFVIYDDDDQKRLMARVLKDLGVEEKLFPPRQVLSAIDRAKNQGIGPADYKPADYFDDVVAKAYAAYEERLQAANAVDFGGLLVSALRLCLPESPVATELAGRFDHVLVDEFQDTNQVQYRLVRYLSRRSGSITVVGDEDQSIYRWRGADIRNILDFERDHAGARVVKLEENYRSTGNVLRTANAIIARNRERRPKRLFTSRGEGDPIVMFEGESERSEADFVATRIAGSLDEGASPRDFAVFYRTNGQSRVLEEALRARDIPYTVVGGTRFYDRAEIKDLIAYLRVVQNPDDLMGLLRIINVPARGIGDSTVERIGALARERGLTYPAALSIAAEDDGVLGTGPRKKVAAFRDLLLELRDAATTLSPAALAEKILEASGYRDALAAEASMEAEGRLENLMELVAQMREYERESEDPTLAGFLERVALVSDVDGFDPEKGAVSLMTVHTAKGLEFPIVFITGLEEMIFPHARSIDEEPALEEERRLCYVAVTRAMKRLYLCRARVRRLSGQVLGGVPSRFLRDVPSELLESIVEPRPAYLQAETEGAGPWGGRWNRGGNGVGERVGWRQEPSRPFGQAARPATPKAPSSGVTVHYDEGAMAPSADEELGLRVGMKMRHAKYGVGEVRAWQSSLEGLKVTLRFSAVGVKTILARFLTRV